jgi:2-polyprenyl-3-methyl-5-hydroxy-6-metoxy-1,4-benzoquinol methylase
VITSTKPQGNARHLADHFCRICQSPEIVAAGEVEYYSGFAWPIYDCAGCGCRFTSHDESIYNWLHQQPRSVYGVYRDLAETARQLFEKGDVQGLKEHLSQTPKYKFVIDSIERLPRTSRLLEIGCSRGQLTSYFILAGYNVLGTDVSPEAIGAAKQDFGNHFTSTDSMSIRESAPYDIVYHTGMIGCVADPLKTTNEALSLLKPGGRLFFNAPNRDACALKDQLWIDASPPPDVVTLFPPGFWTKRFRDVVDVEENIEMLPPGRSFGIAMRQLFGWRWKPPKPSALESSVNNYKGPSRSKWSDRVWSKAERAASAIGLVRLTRARPAPFGIFVAIVRK